MKKTETKKPKKPAIRLSPAEEGFIKTISAQMKKDGTRAWFQIHSAAVAAIINSLKSKWILAWDQTLNGYVLTGKELPF